MTPELWQRVCRAYDRAAELEVQELAEFLGTLRQTDADAAVAVEELLKRRAQVDTAPGTPNDLSVGLLDTEAPGGTSGQAAQREAWARDRFRAVDEEWPERIGGYRITRELARGGMGVVLLATDEKFKRPIAVKVLARDHAHKPELVLRFLEEAQLMGRLQHPGIPPVHDCGELPDGRPYLAMKLIKGQTLSEMLRARANAAAGRDLSRWLSIFEQICHTLAYAHVRRILHRDLKPGNIMVGAHGEVQVMDWGLAKVLPKRASQAGDSKQATREAASFVPSPSLVGTATAAGAVMGTIAYMAPEQARGEVEFLDERCDVFGLGAILCDILTGRPPFAAGTITDQIDMARAGNLVPAFSRLDQCGADPKLIALAKQCLAAERAQRPDDAGAVAQALIEYQAAFQARLKTAEIEQAAAEVKAAEEHKRRVAGRRWAILVLVLVSSLTLSLIVGTVISIHYAVDANAQAKRANKEAKAALREAEERTKAKRLADRRGYIANLRLVQTAWEGNQPERVVPLLLKQLPEHTDGIDLRGFEWYYWWALAHSSVEWKVGNMCEAVVFSPKGDKLAAACMTHVMVRDHKGEERRLEVPAFTVDFHADGVRLALGCEGKVVLWDLVQKKSIKEFAQRSKMKRVAPVAFSADGKYLAFGEDDNVRVVTLATEEEINLPAVGSVQALAFHPDGSFLAESTEDSMSVFREPLQDHNQLSLKNALSLKNLVSLESYRSLAFSPKEALLACAGKSVKLWDVKTKKEVRTLLHMGEPVNGVAFSGDGKLVAAAGYDRTVRLWDVQGNDRGVLRGHSRMVMSVAFSPDGKRLASGSRDDTVRLWRAEEPGLRHLDPVPTKAKTIIFTPDSRRLIRAWQGVTASEIGSAKAAWSYVPPGINLRSLAVSPDGKHLLAGADGPKDRYRLFLMDPTTGTELRVYQGAGAPVGSVAFHPDGKRFATVDVNDRLMLWALEHETPRTTIDLEKSKKVIKVVYRNDKELVVCDPRGGVVVHDAEDGKELYRLGKHEKSVLDLACSRDGKLLATASEDNTIELWDMESRRKLHTLVGHIVSVNAVAFSPDGQRLASASQDRTLRLWDTVTGQEVLSLPSRDLPFTSVAFSGDNQYLATCAFNEINWRTGETDDSEVRVWFAPRHAQ